MLPDAVSNPGPQTYESGALPNALRGPAVKIIKYHSSFLLFMTLYIALRPFTIVIIVFSW